MIHGHFCTVSQFFGPHPLSGPHGPLLDRYRSRQVQRHIQPSANEQVPPCQKDCPQGFRLRSWPYDGRGPPVHVANGPNAFCRGFEKFIGFNIAPFINRDVRVFQMEQVRHRTDARGDKDFPLPVLPFSHQFHGLQGQQPFPHFRCGRKGFPC